MGFTEDLTEYGLTRQEATIYACLLCQGSMTGYEIAKDTGISKSNVYTAVKELVQKGAAVLEDILRSILKDSARIIKDTFRPLKSGSSKNSPKDHRYRKDI